VIPIQISTAKLTLGGYQNQILITAADSVSIAKLDANLRVISPPQEVTIEKYLLTEDNYRVAESETLRVVIDNYGTMDALDFQVAASLHQGDLFVWQDTLQVAYLAALSSKTLDFAPWLVDREGDLDLEIAILGIEGDAHPENNVLEETLEIETLVDGFWADFKPIWDIEGWGLTDMTGYTDGWSMQGSGGVTPYPPNQDNRLTFLPGVNVGGLTTFAIKYYALYQLEDGADFGSFEISPDRSTWTVLEEYTGTDLSWHRHTLDLTDYCGTAGDSLWFRFRFTSDDAGGALGYFVDQISFLVPELASRRETAIRPADLFLAPNMPNPFNPSTNLRYRLPTAGPVHLDVFDLRGRRIRQLFNGSREPGWHQLSWDGRNDSGLEASAGIYVLRLSSAQRTMSRKMLLIR